MITEILKETGSAKIKDDKELFIGLKTYLKGEKLDLINKDFWNTREGNKSAIQQKYPKLIQQLSFYYSILADVNGFIKESQANNKNKDSIKNKIIVCTKLYNKSLQALADMYGLLENGSVMNTFLLWRTIYENYVITKYIINGAEEEAKLFNEYETVQKNKLLGIKLTKEEKAKFAKKFGRDYDSNEFCWAKNLRGKRIFIKLARSVKEKKFYKYYLLSNYISRTSVFSVNNGIVYNEKAANKTTVYSPDEVTKSLNVFIAVISEYAGIMIESYIDDKKQKDTLKKIVTFYGKEIDRKWKKY